MDSMLDPYTLMGMACMIPLLEAIDSLVTFAHSRDIVICNFIATLKVCKGQLYTIYYNRALAFKSNKFFGYKRLIDGSHKRIHLRWQLLSDGFDLNDTNHDVQRIVFHVKGEWGMHA